MLHKYLGNNNNLLQPINLHSHNARPRREHNRDNYWIEARWTGQPKILLVLDIYKQNDN